MKKRTAPAPAGAVQILTPRAYHDTQSQISVSDLNNPISPANQISGKCWRAVHIQDRGSNTSQAARGQGRRINSNVVGERPRKDMGDIDALAAGISSPRAVRVHELAVLSLFSFFLGN